MVKKSKIPKHLKDGPSTACGGWVVFASLLSAGYALAALEKSRAKYLCGYVESAKKRYYFCRYGFFNDPIIYK